MISHVVYLCVTTLQCLCASLTKSRTASTFREEKKCIDDVVTNCKDEDHGINFSIFLGSAFIVNKFPQKCASCAPDLARKEVITR